VRICIHKKKQKQNKINSGTFFDISPDFIEHLAHKTIGKKKWQKKVFLSHLNVDFCHIKTFHVRNFKSHILPIDVFHNADEQKLSKERCRTKSILS